MKMKCRLADLSERQLLERFSDLVRLDRHNTARLLAYIAEIDERKIWAKHACSSMFAFCMERFHMSEQVTAKRIWAARTARRFPAILSMVSGGELHLSGIALLAKHLTEANHRQVLARARHKSSREIQVLVAELAPRADVRSRVRALPRTATRALRAKTDGVSSDIPVERPDGLPGGAGADASAATVIGLPVRETRCRLNDTPGDVPTRVSHGLRHDAPGEFTGTAHPAPGTRRPAYRKPITALAPRRFKIEITVDQDTHDKLRTLQDLLRHRFPSADPALIVSRAIELLLDDTLEKKAALTGNARGHAGSDASRRTADTGATGTRATETSAAGMGANDTSTDRSGTAPSRKERSRAIPAAIRRAVWKRDRGRCTFVDEKGRRCRETGGVEYHHEIPYGRGGRHEAENIALRCRAHNQYQADLDFGCEFMLRKRRDASLHSARNVQRPSGG